MDLEKVRVKHKYRQVASQVNGLCCEDDCPVCAQRELLELIEQEIIDYRGKLYYIELRDKYSMVSIKWHRLRERLGLKG